MITVTIYIFIDLLVSVREPVQESERRIVNAEVRRELMELRDGIVIVTN